MAGLYLRSSLLVLLWTSAWAAPFPPLLSETKLFVSLHPLVASPELIAYDINLSFWSDGAQKQRWMQLPPQTKMHYSAHDQWSFPSGTLFVKHFSRGDGSSIETRLLRVEKTNILGASYRWRGDNTDADLLSTNLVLPLPATGGAPKSWYYPSTEDCRTCHNANAGFVLGLNTRQLNRVDSNGKSQLAAWNELQLFDQPLSEHDISVADHLSQDSLEVSVRSYLDVNCSFCHRPNGTVSYFDARWSSPLEHLVQAPVFFNQGIDAARIIAPRDPWRSVLLLRLQSLDGLKMPPLAHQEVDTRAVAMLAKWIQSLPGAEVTPPPVMQPPGGEFATAVAVTLSHPDANAVIRFTTDGSSPGKTAAIYNKPITVTEPVTIRARAYNNNSVRSVTVQQTYIISRSAGSSEARQ